jgi:hypothetical protein
MSHANLEIDFILLDTIVGGNWVNTVMDGAVTPFYPKWKSMDCTSRASIAGEVGRDVGLLGPSAIGALAGPQGLSAGLLAGSLIDGVTRQYALVSYNEGCKAAEAAKK